MKIIPILLALAMVGCRGVRSPSKTSGDPFHGGDGRIFFEQRGNVTVIWSAQRRSPDSKDVKLGSGEPDKGGKAGSGEAGKKGKKQ